MTRIFLASVASLALSASAGLAQSVADQVVAGLQSQGYTRIEVTEGPTQVKVEAIQGSTKIEYVYDRATGAILKQEIEAVDADDDTRPGVQIRRGEDSLRDGDDDGPLHDVGDDHGGDDDDDRFDDHGGDRDDDDDDDNDDRSGRDGSDDESDDSSGGSGGDDDGDGRSGSGSGGSGSDDGDDDDDSDDHGGSRHGGDDD